MRRPLGVHRRFHTEEPVGRDCLARPCQAQQPPDLIAVALRRTERVWRFVLVGHRSNALAPAWIAANASRNASLARDNNDSAAFGLTVNRRAISCTDSS